jgi:pimeloyl-ACP methyl ester carboxylesterase
MTSERALIELAAQEHGLHIAEFVEPDRQTLQADALRLHYLDWGRRGRPPLVFLHGGGQTAHTWDLVALALRPEYHVLAVDLPGHGDSEWRADGDYSPRTNAREIAALLDRLALGRVVLVGMSLGGLTGIAYAGACPQRLAGLVIVDVGPEVREEGAREIGAFMRENRPLEVESIDELLDRARAFNPTRPLHHLRYSLSHSLRRQPNGKWTWKYDPRLVRSAGEPRSPTGDYTVLWEEVARITCPALVVQGANSRVFLPEDAAKLAARLPNGRWVQVPRAGHAVQGDNPTEFAACLRRFLGEIGHHT